MKKAIIALSGIAILLIAVVLVVNAQGKTEEGKKAKTEMKEDCSKCPSTSSCGETAAAKEKADSKSCCPSGASGTAVAATEEMPSGKAAAAPCCGSKAETKTN